MKRVFFAVVLFGTLGVRVHVLATATTGQFQLDQTDVRLAGQISFTVEVQAMPASNSPNTSQYWPAVYLDCDDAAGVNVIDYWYVANPGGPGSYTAHWPAYGAFDVTPYPEAMHCTATLFFTRDQPTKYYQNKIVSKGNTLAAMTFSVAGP